MFAYWLQGGRIDLGFLGAAQIDRFANINTTVIGGYHASRKVRLPGAGGAPEIAASCKEVLITLRQNAARVRRDGSTSSPPPVTSTAATAAARLRLPGRGPTAVITDLGILTPDPVTKELTLTSVHPGVTVETVRRRNRLAAEGRRHARHHRRADGGRAVGAARPAGAHRRRHTPVRPERKLQEIFSCDVAPCD